MLDMNQVIANNIINLLKKHNKRQQDLAEGIGTSKQIVSKMLSGTRAINAVELKRIAEFLNTTMDELVKIPETLPNLDMVHVFMGKVKTESAKQCISCADEIIDISIEQLKKVQLKHTESPLHYLEYLETYRAICNYRRIVPFG